MTFPLSSGGWAFALLGLVLMAGCGDRPRTVKVRGRVTFDGGAAPDVGVIYFTSVETARPGMASFDTKGNYVATTWHPGDGLLPGTYQVYLECWEEPPNMEGKPVKSYLPPKYMSPGTSGLELVVDGKQRRQEFDIDVITTAGNE